MKCIHSTDPSVELCPAKVPLFFMYSPLKCTFECTQKANYLFGLKRISDMSFLTPSQIGVGQT